MEQSDNHCGVYSSADASAGLAPLFRHHAPLNLGGFERLGTDTAEMAVSPLAIVEHLYVVEDIRAGQLTRAVDAFLDPLLFQGAEERLDDSIIPAIASTTHAGVGEAWQCTYERKTPYLGITTKAGWFNRKKNKIGKWLTKRRREIARITRREQERMTE